MSDYLGPVSKQCTDKILAQMNSSFFEIKGIEGGICCICKIKDKGKTIPVVITNKLADIEFSNSIEISVNNRTKIIEFGRTRLINEELGVSVIEIKNNRIKNLNCLEIDDDLYKKDVEIFYNKENIYIIQTDNRNKSFVSQGLLNYINNNVIFYSANLIPDYKSFYIFNLTNNKIIGINSSNPKYDNRGIFLKNVINRFINSYNNKFKMNNEINLLIKVDQVDINKEIYFLDNNGIFFNNYNNIGLKKLNKLNTEIYINGQLSEYNNYFKPVKEGE